MIFIIRHLVGDLTGLLDALGIEKAVIVGHDWGGILIWQMALLAPHRVAAFVGVNTPFFPRPAAPLTQIIRAMAQGNFLRSPRAEPAQRSRHVTFEFGFRHSGFLNLALSAFGAFMIRIILIRPPH